MKQFLNSKDVIFKQRLTNPNSPDITEKDGTKIWLDENKRKHRPGNRPAVVHPDGAQEWWIHGEQRQKNRFLPGRQDSSGAAYWYKNNKLIARRDSEGNLFRMKNSKLDAVGKPAFIDKHNNKFYYSNGSLSCDFGPAIIINEKDPKNPYKENDLFPKKYYWKGVGFSKEEDWIKYKNKA